MSFPIFRRLFFLLPALLLGFALRAQTYEPGLVVRTNGDTLRGQIENGFWVEPPRFIRFRPSPESPSELLLPRQLRAVVFTGGRYFRHEVLPLDHAAETQLSRLQSGNFTDVQQDSVLAEVLVEGPVSLLRVVLSATPHYLLVAPDRAPLDMSARRYLRPGQNGAQLIMDGNNYRGQLSVYFADCPAARNLAATSDFTLNDLTAVTQAYNESCSEARRLGRSWQIQSFPRRKVALRGGLLAGLRYNRIERVSGPLSATCVDCRPRPFVGLYADLLQPSRTSAVYGELSLSAFRSAGFQYVWINTAPGYAYNEYAFRAWLVTARTGLRFFFPLPHEQQWLVGLGFELNKVLAPTFTSQSLPAMAPLPLEQVGYAQTTYCPNLSVGWRRQRLTVTLDGQLYASARNNALGSFAAYFFGSNFALRGGIGYQLGGNPDQPRPAVGTGH